MEKCGFSELYVLCGSIRNVAITRKLRDIGNDRELALSSCVVCVVFVIENSSTIELFNVVVNNRNLIILQQKLRIVIKMGSNKHYTFKSEKKTFLTTYDKRTYMKVRYKLFVVIIRLSQPSAYLLSYLLLIVRPQTDLHLL